MRLVAFLLLALPLATAADPIGEVDTVFKWIGPDHKIVVDAYDAVSYTHLDVYKRQMYKPS